MDLAWMGGGGRGGGAGPKVMRGGRSRRAAGAVKGAGDSTV